jgi:hypothetical protein
MSDSHDLLLSNIAMYWVVGMEKMLSHKGPPCCRPHLWAFHIPVTLVCVPKWWRVMSDEGPVLRYCTLCIPDCPTRYTSETCSLGKG